MRIWSTNIANWNHYSLSHSHHCYISLPEIRQWVGRDSFLVVGELNSNNLNYIKCNLSTTSQEITNGHIRCNSAQFGHNSRTVSWPAFRGRIWLEYESKCERNLTIMGERHLAVASGSGTVNTYIILRTIQARRVRIENLMRMGCRMR